MEMNNPKMGIITEEMLTERKHLIRMMGGKKETKYGKTKVKEIRPLDRILHRRDGKRTQYYFTTGRKVDKILLPEDEDILQQLSTKRSDSWKKSIADPSPKAELKKEAEEQKAGQQEDGRSSGGQTDMVKKLQGIDEGTKLSEEEKTIRRRRRKVNNYMKPTYKWRMMGNALERLQIPEEELQFEELMDYDPNFFSTFKEKPIKEEKFWRQEYRDEKRKTFRSNLISAYMSDEMALAKQVDILHEKELAESEYNLKIAQDCLLTFLMERSAETERLRDYLSHTQIRIEKEKKKIGKLEKLEKMVQMKIYSEDRQVDDLKKWKKFFYDISPEEWKKEFDEDCEKRMEVYKDKIETLEVDLKRFETFRGNECYQLRNCVDNLLKMMRTYSSELFYFKDSKEVTEVLRRMQQKSLQIIKHHGDILNCKGEIEKCLKLKNDYEEKSNEFMAKDIEEIESTLESVRIECEEMRDSFYRITDGPLKDILTNKEDLTVKALVKDLYEDLIRNGEGMSQVDMMREIEWEMLDMWRRIEREPIELVKKISRQVCFTRDKEMAAAVKARKRSTEISWMLKGLERAYEIPPGPIICKPIYPRSPELVKSKRAESRSISTGQRGIHTEYLTEFYTVDATPTPEQSSPSQLPFESTSSM